MEIIQPNLDFIFIQGDLRFQAAYLKTQSFWADLATEVPSSTRENHYGWIGRIPQMREWLGERVVNNVATREYTVANKTFEATLGLKREDIQDDQLGIFNMSLDMLAMQAKLWPDKLITDIMQGGHGATAPFQCFDGQPFFSTIHPVNVDEAAAGTYRNYQASGCALTSANLSAVYAEMTSYVLEDGRPAGVVPNLLVVPPQLKLAAMQILNATFTAPAVAAGQNAASVMQSNMLQGWCNTLVHPYLANQATTWYLLDTQSFVKPFVWQLREPVEFTYKTNPGDDNVFKRREYLYGLYGRGNAGFSLPFLAYKAVA